MTSPNNENLRKLQLIDLYILLEVKRICELHNIHYFLVGGTLLGAVRHNGFIPWDDDIDIGMLRKDYDKFIDVCKYELKSNFYLQTKENDKLYPNPWAKVRLKNTVRMEDGLQYSKSYGYGIDIDIFPFDNLPENPILQLLISKALKITWSMYRYRCGFKNKNKSILKKTLLKTYSTVNLLITKDKLSSIIDKFMTMYNNKQTKYVINYAGAYNYKRERTEKNIVSNCSELKFENHTFPAPIRYDEYLQNVYGHDYMVIPKKENQIQHSIYCLDFGKYVDIDKISPEKWDEYIH